MKTKTAPRSEEFVPAVRSVLMKTEVVSHTRRTFWVKRSCCGVQAMHSTICCPNTSTATATHFLNQQHAQTCGRPRSATLWIHIPVRFQPTGLWQRSASMRKRHCEDARRSSSISSTSLRPSQLSASGSTQLCSHQSISSYSASL